MIMNKVVINSLKLTHKLKIILEKLISFEFKFLEFHIVFLVIVKYCLEFYTLLSQTQSSFQSCSRDKRILYYIKSHFRMIFIWLILFLVLMWFILIVIIFVFVLNSPSKPTLMWIFPLDWDIAIFSCLLQRYKIILLDRLYLILMAQWIWVYQSIKTSNSEDPNKE